MSDVDTVNRDLNLLAPKFAIAVQAALAACKAQNLDAIVNEGYRSQARQAWLYAQGRTRPGDIVTNAPTSLTSWHGYGLAVDIIHRTKAYWPYGRGSSKNEAWFRNVAAVFKAHDCAWGGDWTHPDTPHMQWGRCTASPTQGARDLFRTQGVQAVWRSLKATDGDWPAATATGSKTLWLTYGDARVYRVGSGSAYCYETAHVSIDADGSPRAYHPNDTGLDALANAGFPNGGWRSVLAVDPNDGGKPFVQTSGPDQGYFVSKTSLQDATLSAIDPARYVNAQTIPYLVFPGDFYAIKGTGNWGDLAMVRDLSNGRDTAAIVADGGPSKAPLGEMSIALGAALSQATPNPRNGAGSPKGPFQCMIFPGSRSTPAWPRSFAEIDATARSLLLQNGGWPS